MSKKRSQAQSQETLSPEEDLVAAVDRFAEDLRSFLLLLARKTGALPPESKL